ncbi:MAG: ACP S-malonyltransferase [Clostridia bacterium]|nr:ACP S-malonyltransferase [Clostridia bacterium]
MGKIAFVFPGQGAQYVGMAREIAENYKVASEVFDIACESLGYDIRDLIFNGPEDKLKITKNTQPAILTASWAIYKALEESGIRPDYTAGLSLGEFTAHVLAGSLDFADAVALVEKRGMFMQQEVPEGVGGMSAILGLDEETVEQVCKDVSDYGYAACANYNCPGQTVISGELAALEKAGEILMEKGAKRVIPLQVSAPFHCRLLKGAGEKLAAELEKIEIKEMSIPVFANVTGEMIKSREDIKGLLVDQVSNTVKWTNIIKNLIAEGVDTFVEIGPGKVLSGLIKKTDKEVNILNAEDLNTLENVIHVLEAV